MAKLNEIDRDLGWVWMVIPLLAVELCASYEVVRASAGYVGEYGRVANRAWYQVAREPGAAAARAWFVRHAWYSAAFAAITGITVVGIQKEGRGWLTVRRGTFVGMLVISALTIVDGPRRPEWRISESLVRGLGMHAALGGLLINCLVVAWVVRGSTVGRWGWRVGVATAVAAGGSGFVLAGWRPAQVEDLLRQPRDLAHMLAAVVMMGVGLGALRARRGRRWLVAVLLLAGAAVVWTGVLMTIDGSDRTTPVGWLRGPVVQEAGRE